MKTVFNLQTEQFEEFLDQTHYIEETHCKFTDKEVLQIIFNEEDETHLHNEENPELDAEAVKLFREKNLNFLTIK